MYAAPNRRTAHRLVALDVPTPSWLRAPGECPGMYALESAMDELAHAAGIDPVELRILNDPDVHPESGQRFSSRNLVACLREGAERFGWERRGEPGARRDGRWLHGMGVASSTYPAYQMPSQAAVRARRDGGYVVRIAAADIGTGARTVLAQIAADALEVPIERVVDQGRRQRLPARQRGRRLVGHRVVGHRGRARLPRAARAARPSTAARCPRTASRRPPTRPSS